MAVKIKRVESASSAARAGIAAGDTLLEIGGEAIHDVLDYRFYIAEPLVELRLERGGAAYTVTIKKGQYEDIGLEFETYLMDNTHHCTNKCIFCFVDQMPKGLRDTLYFKDDDSRLSFFFGNYITLTNMTEAEVERIIKMRISPINISVHTTNPELRVQMMKNPRAATSLGYIGRLAQAGIRLNTQLVLCPGINDGVELARTLRDLEGFLPALASIACVPVGLTAHREGLHNLHAYTAVEAEVTLTQILAFGDEMLEKHGTRLVYPADEFFLLAGRPLPDSPFYEDFPQLENGVGATTLLREEFAYALEDLRESGTRPTPKTLTVATGMAAYPTIQALAQAFTAVYPQVKISTIGVTNTYLGNTVTVAGLVTATDLLAQLGGKVEGKLVLPACMLRRERDLFLDGMRLTELSEKLGVEIVLAENNGEGLLQAFAE